jgi:hypothetical protein
MDSYHFKTNGIDRIWHMLSRSSTQEKKRALDIWKQKMHHQHYSVSKFRKLIKRRNDENLR